MPSARLGLLVYATDTGLGIQTRALYRHLKPTKAMLVDLSALNHMPVHDDWYDYTLRTNGFPTNAEIDQFLDGLDVVFYCETPLNYYLVARARALGIKTVCQPNYEFADHLTPAELRSPSLPRPDLFASPSTWHLDDLAQVTPTRHVPVPIDLETLPRRTITQARRFFHVAGRPAVRDRNGTLDFIAAARMARTYIPDATFTLYCQQPTSDIQNALAGSGVQLVGHVPHPADIYATGDVLVLPRRYGGLCLPVQEAIGCGIPVLMTGVSPNNDLLPADWLITVTRRVEQLVTRGPIDVYQVNVTALAQKMLDLYRHDDAVQLMHEQAKELGALMSWEALLPLYEEMLTPELTKGITR